MKLVYLRTCIAAMIMCLTSSIVGPMAVARESILTGASLFANEPLSKERELELPALVKWRDTAKVTGVGEQLLNFLDNTDAALQFNSCDSHSLYKRAYLLGLIGCTNMAINDLNKAIMQDPSHSELHRERGVCYVDLQNYEKALVDLNHAINLNPSSGDSRLARARLLLILGRPRQALDDLLLCQRGSLEFKPVLPGELPANFYNAVDYYLANCYEALGRKHEAIHHYQESKRLSTLPSEGAYVHRYADQPTDAADCLKRLQGF